MALEDHHLPYVAAARAPPNPFRGKSAPRRWRPSSIESQWSASESSASSRHRDASSSSSRSRSSSSSVSEVRSVPPWEAPSHHPKVYNYDLPCEFSFLGCELRFEPEDFEDWIEHSLSHFSGCAPPPLAVCNFCNNGTGIFRDEKNRMFNWRDRMIHIGGHFARDGPTNVRPDYWVVEYMRDNELLSKEDYTTGLNYARKPQYGDILQTQDEAEVVRIFRRTNENNRMESDSLRSEQQEIIKKKKRVTILQNPTGSAQDRLAPKRDKSSTKPLRRRVVVIHQGDRGDALNETIPAPSETCHGHHPKLDVLCREGLPVEHPIIPRFNSSTMNPYPTAFSRASEVSETMCSADVTDWEGEDDDNEVIPHVHPHQNRDNIELLLSRLKGVLPTHFADQLWEDLSIKFTQEWDAMTRQRPGTSTSGSSSTTDPIVNRGITSQRQASKRPRGSRDDEFEDDDGDSLLDPSGQPTNGVDTTLMFACPFRKHDPRKYSVQDWPKCALVPHSTVSRLKAHLYKYHVIHQCTRCKNLFNSEEEVDEHLEATEGCESKPRRPVDGITKSMYNQIKSRKKAFKGQTEVNRWEQIYKILFPDEVIPGPYFEPVQDHETRSSGTPDTSDLEAHLLQELPRLFQRSLDLAAGFDLPPVDNRVRDRAATLFRDALASTISNYRSTATQRQNDSRAISTQDENFANLRISSTNSSDSGYVSHNIGVSEQNRRAAAPENANGQNSAQDSSTDFLSAPLHTVDHAFMGNFDMEAFIGQSEDLYNG